MFLIIILFCSISMLGAGYYAFMAAAKPQQHLLLGATLTPEQMRSPQVQEVVRNYRRQVKRLALLCILLHVPLCFLANWYLSVFLILYFLWCGILYGGGYFLYQKYFQKIYSLKKQQGWFMEDSAHLVTIDTKLSHASGKMPLSAWWFLPSFLVCLAPLFYPGQETAASPGVIQPLLFALAFGLNLLFLILYYVTARRRNVVYSRDSRINLACNRIAKRLWSLCWIVTAVLNSLSLIYLQWEWRGGQKEDFTALWIYLCFQSVPVLLLFWSLRSMGKQISDLVNTDPEPVVVDEDAYWARGYYYNPNRKSFLAPARPGMTSSLNFNMAHPAARFICYLFWGILAALLLWMVVLFLRLDFTPFGLTIAGNQVSITAGSYDMEFPLEEVEEVSLVDGLPTQDYTKNNGADTGQYLLGKFRLKGYGQCRMYYYIGYAPVVKIVLSECTVYFNTRDSAKTRELYEQLAQKVQKRTGHF